MEFLVPVIEKGEWPSELEELCARLKVLGVGGGFEWHWPLIKPARADMSRNTSMSMISSRRCSYAREPCDQRSSHEDRGNGIHVLYGIDTWGAAEQSDGKQSKP